ncbi:MAG: hypothetical protein QI197_00835 [Candidatus Korarchaeota archaeon]|nr:hypothetical protein [Candidatus Korarchaeota archaeon]
MGSGLRERVLRELSGPEVLHLRELLRRLDVSISELKPVLEEMVREGLVEKFSHGGYTFYRITSEGKGFLLQMEAESQLPSEGVGIGAEVNEGSEIRIEEGESEDTEGGGQVDDSGT